MAGRAPRERIASHRVRRKQALRGRVRRQRDRARPRRLGAPGGAVRSRHRGRLLDRERCRRRGRRHPDRVAGSVDRDRERGRRPAAVAPLRDRSHRRGRRGRGDRLASRLAAAPAGCSCLRPSARSPPRRATSGSSPAGRWPAPPRRSRRRRSSSAPSGSTTRCAPRSCSSPPSSSPLCFRSRRATSALRVRPSRSRSVPRASTRRPRFRPGSRSAPSSC